MGDLAPISASLPDKKNKPHKKQKRHRELDGSEGGERKHKKSKSSGDAPAKAEAEAPTQIEASLPHAPTAEVETNGSPSKSKKEKKKKRSRERRTADQADGDGDSDRPAQDGTVDGSIPGKEKKSKERKKKHKTIEVNEVPSQDDIIPDSQPVPTTADQQDQDSDPDPDLMDVDEAPTGTFNSDVFGEKPADKEYPFFTQTVSQYLPLFPSGLIEPVEGFADQHLRPLLNRYVPSLRSVLLAYRNPRVGEAPGKGALTEESSMDDVALLESVNEYAVSFGWLTVDVDLFRPTRGAWMDGTVNLQGEGHVGVVCWGMFNASIEASRLPRDWRWVDLLSKGKAKGQGKGKKNGREKTAEEAKLPTPEPFDKPEDDATQIHTTGYWVDEAGARIRGGAKLYFRIKHFEVGVSGDYGYLSMEGTMLSEDGEKAKSAEEMEVSRRRRLKHGGLLRREQKRLPEFSMTKFGLNEAEDNEAQRAPVFVASRPGSRPGSDID
ncbi:hypothetical protein F4677DRAFT_318318 [Hypoxylon crocopeplum]|nr:hypothetical protein F4677DRAFT_318318 [Hypoxylon crocopeplum]